MIQPAMLLQDTRPGTAATAALPVRLREGERGALLAHFLALDPEDRRLRFGLPIGDELVRAYVARIEFDHHGVFAIHDDGSRIVAAIHVAHAGESAELGLSVLPGYRRAGLGGALFSRAIIHVRNRGVASVFVHCLTENAAVLHLARKHGMRLVSSGVETSAHLALEPPSRLQPEALEVFALGEVDRDGMVEGGAQVAADLQVGARIGSRPRHDLLEKIGTHGAGA